MKIKEKVSGWLGREGGADDFGKVEWMGESGMKKGNWKLNGIVGVVEE